MESEHVAGTRAYLTPGSAREMLPAGPFLLIGLPACCGRGGSGSVLSPCLLLSQTL